MGKNPNLHTNEQDWPYKGLEALQAMFSFYEAELF